MCPKQCVSRSKADNKLSRRDFLGSSAAFLAGSLLLDGCTSLCRQNLSTKPMFSFGPASKYVPTIKATFVRRKEDYGMWWPGAVYDGQAARRKYTLKLIKIAAKLGVKFDLRPEPIYSLNEAGQWCDSVKADKADGLIVVLLDRQKHSWPTAQRAVDTGIPTVVLSPVGTSFTVNTVKLANKPGCVIYSSEELHQAAYGMKMLKAAAKLKRTRGVVIKGDNRFQHPMPDLGITLQYVPANTFIEEYQNMSETDEILTMSKQYLRQARRRRGATGQDVINGVKSYFAALNILRHEKADAITMDCLGALADKKISLPCLAWSRMLDDGIPAACEADHGAVAAHTIVQYLLDRPGFQQDPVADTANQAIIGAHCTCPTRLNGFNHPSEPFDLVHHHGNRDATVRPTWRKGQRVTSIDILPAGEKIRAEMLISTGVVLDNVSVPPNGGCVVSVKVKFDGDQNVLTFPGFHQIFFYGDYKQQLLEFCRLINLEARVV